MTLLGKFFTVAIALLAAVFMFLALAVNASHRNWRDVVLTGVGNQPGLKSQIEQMDRVNAQLRAESDDIKSALDREMAARRTALASLATQLDQLKKDLENSEKKVTDLTGENTSLVQVQETQTNQLDELMQDNKRLRNSILTEQQRRDQLFTETLELTDSVNQLQGIAASLKERNQQLTQQVTRFEEVVAAKGININDPLDGAPPKRNGLVVQVDRPRQLVLVSIGSDEGLRENHLLEVTRRGQYIGRLKVRRTEPDQAVAEILKDYSEQTLQEGDRVDTTIE